MLLTSCLINPEVTGHFFNSTYMDEECISTLERGYQIPGVSIAAPWFLLVNAAKIFFPFGACVC